MSPRLCAGLSAHLASGLILLSIMIANETVGSEEVQIFRTNDVTLVGTFAAVAGARACALVLSGSGRVDRHSNVRGLKLGINPAIATALASIGVSTFCFDKRGSGSSGGDFLTATMTDNYQDAAAAFGWLRTREPDLPAFAIGHSEGALHAARLAADGEQAVNGVVLIACPARRGEEVLKWQAQQIVPTLPTFTRAILGLLRIDPLKSQEKAFQKIRSTSDKTVRVQGKRLNAGWLRQFMDYAPDSIFKEITAPALVLAGAHDMQVPPEDAATIKDLLRGDCDVRLIMSLSHLLRPDPKCLGPRDYKRSVKHPVSSEAVSAIASWISSHLERPLQGTHEKGEA
jgi:uncharacterized protein